MFWKEVVVLGENSGALSLVRRLAVGLGHQEIERQQ